ncbi:MAG: hypothetical protein ACYC35_29110 [Pirellulales bacterium]
MTHAGKEPAEDAKRAVRRAIELAGLEVREVRMFKSTGLEGRIVLGAASPAGWPHDLPAIELFVAVGFDGAVGEVEIRCAATDGDPLIGVFTAALVQCCRCQLAELPTTLKEVWVARREVIARLEAGEAAPIFDGKWNWTIPREPSLPDFV